MKRRNLTVIIWSSVALGHDVGAVLDNDALSRLGAMLWAAGPVVRLDIDHPD